MGFSKMMVLSGVELFSEKTIEVLYQYFENDFITHTDTLDKAINRKLVE